MDFSNQELTVAGLSPEELAAVTGVDSDQDDAALSEIAEAATGQSTAADPFTGIQSDEVQFTPKLTGELLPEYAQAIENLYGEIDRRADEIQERYLDGSLDESEKRAELRKLDRERDAEILKLNAANSNAEIESQKWQAEQEAFFKQNQGYTQPFLFNALNTEVIRLANQPESAGKTGIQILQAAKASVGRQLADITGTARHNEQESEQHIDNAGRFSHIDRLTGVDFEQALARMSESEQTAYLRSL